MSYYFDGNNDYLFASCPVSSAPITVACWFNANDFSGSMVTLANTSGNDRYRLRISGSPSVVRLVASDGGTDDIVETSSGPSLGTWAHACFVASSNTYRAVYYNGGSKSVDTTNRSITGLSRLQIGNTRESSNNISWWDGRIAEVGVWDTDLTDDEVASLGKGAACSLVRPQNLVFYAPLIREIIDFSKNNLNITTFSNPIVADHPRVYL